MPHFKSSEPGPESPKTLNHRRIATVAPNRCDCQSGRATGVILCLWALLNLTARADETRPNVILIYTDDQGFGDTSHLNPDSGFQTPNIDRIAQEGISFIDAHCSDTVCTPSRYGLLTGRYSWRTELKRGVFEAERECLINDNRMTVASFLKSHGYQTAMIGKWHLGMDFPGEPQSRDWTQPVRDMPLDKGFDYFWGIPASLNYGILAWFEGRHAKVPPTLYTAKKSNARALSDYRIKPPYQNTPDETRQLLGKKGMEIAPDFVDSECLTRFTNKAVEYIRARATQPKDGQPFFLYLPYTSPHKPVIPLPKYRGQGTAGAYGEFMIETDAHVGEILKELDEQKLTNNTLVIFTSDNGPETTWKQRIVKHKHDSRGGYREGKRSIYEGGHRVPFFVRWPAGIRSSGRSSDALICQTDILATVAEILAKPLPADAGEDSESFLPVLRRPQHLHKRAPVVHHAANGRFAVRDGHWKLVMPHQKKNGELYNLQDDRAEKHDLAASQPDVVNTLTEKITRIVTEGRSTKGTQQQNDTGYWEDLTWLTKEHYLKSVNPSNH